MWVLPEPSQYMYFKVNQRTQSNPYHATDWVKFYIAYQYGIGHVRCPCNGHGVACLWFVPRSPRQVTCDMQTSFDVLMNTALDVKYSYEVPKGPLNLG